MRSLRTAFGWLTVFPVGTDPATPDRRLGGAVIAAVPVVGVVLGALVALFGAAMAHTDLPTPVSGVLAVAILVLLTRGMHVDGLADTADGLGCYGPPSRVAEVMRSGSVGPFGATTLILVLGVQAAGFSAFFAESRWYEAAFAVALGRLGAVTAARTALPPAHPDGFGALVAGTQRTSIPVWTAVALAGAVLCGFTSSATDFAPRAAIAAAVTVLAVALLAGVFSRHCARRMGGVSGDVLGATIELGVTIAVVGLLLVGR